MPLEITDIRRTIALGVGLGGKSKMGLFALLASSRYRPPRWWRRWFAAVTPDIVISPSLLNGLQLLIDPRDWSQTVIFEEVLLRNGYDLNKIGFVPEIIIDCGAHIGIFSLLARSKFSRAKVMVFEPNPQNIYYLSRQILMNDLDIQLVEAAVSTKAGKMNFAWSNSHSGRLDHDVTTNEGTKVEVVNFPEIVSELNPSSLLLKMDIEGEELAILPILVPTLPENSAIFFETHTGISGWQTIANLLETNGFRVEQINARGEFYDGFACR